MVNKKIVLLSAAAALLAAAPATVVLSSLGQTKEVSAEKAAASVDIAAGETPASGKGKAVVTIAAAAQSFAVPGMNPVAENDTLVLLMNKDTAETAVGDKRTGKLWFSNPQDRADDKKAAPFERDALGSQLSITFADGIGNLKTLLSYNDSVQNKQFAIETLKDGARVTYTFGDMSKGIDALPKKISKARMDQFMSKLDKQAASYAIRRYLLDKGSNVYERFDQALKSDVTLGKVTAAFQAAGYTDADLKQDNEENGIKADGAGTKPVFTVELDYKLDGENLVVTVPADKIKEPKNNSLTELSLFKYFSAAGLSEKGYMLVPDGSGSLIYLNNGKFKDDIYSQPIYGADEAIRKRVKDQNDEGARLPVFGMKDGNDAMYGIVEKGAGLASVNAEVSGRTNSYNYVYTTFSLRKQDELPMGNGQTFNYVSLLQKTRSEGEFSVRYGFLSGDKASYAGMAEAYQNYLVNVYHMKRRQPEAELPFYLDLVGSIPKRKSFLGIPYEAMEPLTTFAQAEQIVKELNGAQIGNIDLRYLGWFNGGVNHKVPTHVSVDGELGGKKGLEKLADTLKQSGAKLYPDVSFLRVYHNTWSFSPSKDASRYITRSVVEKYPYDRAILRPWIGLGSFYMLSPDKLPDYVDDFLDAYEPLGFGGLSLRELGSELDPDYRSGRQYDRGRAETVVAEQLKKISARQPDLLVTGGNGYVLPYASQIVDMPLTDSNFNITDEPVPFYQMVVHGFIPYAGQSFNLADDQDVQTNLLKAVEYGANIRFTWSYAPPEAVKDTEFNDLYSINYAIWIDSAKKAYAQMNAALKDVQGKRMIGHETIAEGVYATTYEGGATVYVNYTDAPVRAGGVTVGARSFAVGGEG